jgi:hypothetical protein
MSKLVKRVAVAIATAGLAAGIATAAIPASAATAAPATHAVTTSAQSPRFLFGSNVLELQFQGNTFKYPVRLFSFPVAPGVLLIRGSLHDGFEPVPINLRLTGIQIRREVVLTVQYPTFGPDAGSQGDRTFTGTISFGGHLSGVWDETGTEAGTGTWDLEFPVF